MPVLPPPVPGLTWRSATLDDAAALARLHAACYEVDGGYLMVPDEYRNELSSRDDDPVLDTVVAADDAGEIVAFGLVHVPGGERTERRAFPWGHVHPSWRRRGLGSAVLEWQEARAGERFAAHDDGLPTVIRVSAYDTQADRLALFERFGYTPARYFVEMLRRLDEPLPEAALPEGVEIRAWSDESSEAARLAHNAAFADHWGSQPITAHAWDLWHDEFFLPEASFVAMDGAEVVGYVSGAMYPHDFESRGRTEGWIEGLGVVRSHRRRGIAAALLAAAMRSFRGRELQFAAIGVDAENPTGAFGLYSGLGFVEEKRSITFLKPGV
jgi:mycothiol synthase